MSNPYHEEDKKNGVWHITCGDTGPEDALSKFCGDHSELRITAMTLYSLKTWQYWILVTEPKESK